MTKATARPTNAQLQKAQAKRDRKERALERLEEKATFGYSVEQFISRDYTA